MSCQLLATRRELTLSDIQYDSPMCGNIKNAFGTMTIDNDLMGSVLIFDINLNESYKSCRLCRILPVYCNISVPSGLSQDTNYNLKVITIDHDSISSVSFAIRNKTSAIMSSSGQCGKKQRLVILVIANIKEPTDRDILLIGRDSLSDIQQCDSTNNLADLSCGISFSYFYVDYETTNCISMNETTKEIVNPLEYHIPLYYFYEYSLIPNDLTLCGESWYSIYERSRLDLWCDPDLPLYIKEKPWYDTALLVTTAYINGRRDSLIWLTLETLERTCDSRMLGIPIEETIFYNMSILLRVDRPQYDTPDICEWMEKDGFMINKENVTLPVYLQHYDKWYFVLYKYIVLTDENMYWKASLLFTLPFVLIFILLIATTVTVYHIFHKKHNQYEYVS